MWCTTTAGPFIVLILRQLRTLPTFKNKSRTSMQTTSHSLITYIIKEFFVQKIDFIIEDNPDMSGNVPAVKKLVTLFCKQSFICNSDKVKALCKVPIKITIFPTVSLVACHCSFNYIFLKYWMIAVVSSQLCFTWYCKQKNVLQIIWKVKFIYINLIR